MFIENKGQFHIHQSDEPVLYAYDGGPNTIFFTKKGVNFSFLKTWSQPKDRTKLPDKFTTIEDWKKHEAEQHRMLYESDAINMTWENANPNVEIIAYEPTTDYYSYSKEDKNRNVSNINYINAYKKIIYKNIYPNIDVEYVFHPEDGIKYSLILHPGADISKVKMTYSVTPQISGNGDVHIPTKFGDIIDHAPLTFYSNNNLSYIGTYFIQNGNTISFKLNNYDSKKTVIIDPWTQSPTLPNSNGVWECERDGAGNVYIIGGCMPMKLLKYNATGTLQWTYVTPYDTANNWLGTFVTDLAGNSFVTSGSIAALQKINPSGGLVWSSPAPLFNTDEYWNIAFNCDQTRMIIGGTTGSMVQLMGAIFDVNTSNGSINSTQVVGYGNMFGIPPIIEEVRSITSCRNSRYYFLTLDTIGSIDDDFSACGSNSPIIFRENSGYSLGYKCENYRPNNGNSGIMAIRANRYFVYTQNGTNVQKRSLVDGSILAAAAIPGGLSVSSLGRNQVGNSGIDIDSCGNVYVGSGNAIIKYDANLNLITSIATTYKVSDVCVTNGGNVIFCGTTGTNSNTNRIGTLQYANMSACLPMTLFCCDANVCPAGPFCDNGAPVALTATTPGGTWGGPGVSAGGVFDPAAAGIGTHTITYTLSCGTGAVDITVNGCASLSVCAETNGNISVSGGYGPYTWYEWQAAGTTPITNQAECQSCGYTWMPFMNECMNGVIPVTDCNSPAGWSTIGTGSSITPTANYPIRVVDAYGNEYTINSFGLLTACSACPTLTITSSNIVNVCGSATNGSFSVTTNGGSGPYDYTLMLGSTTIATFTGVTGSQSFTGLGAGTYTLNVLDANSCPGTITVTISSSANLTPTITGPTSICAGSNAMLNAGSGYTSYLWSTNETTQTIIVASSGTYSVTVSDGSCSGSTSVTITQSASINPTITGQLTICPGTSTILDAGSGYNGYQWSSGGSTQTISVNSSGTYSVTVSDANGCSGSTSVDVIVIATLPVTASADPQTVCPGNPVTLTATGGGTYLWNTTPPTYDSVFIVHPLTTTTYVVTVAYNGCEGTASVTVMIDSSLVVVTSTTNAGCAHNDGTAMVVVSTTGYTFVWNTDPPQYTQTATGLAEGTYSVTVGFNGCSGIGTATVFKEPGPEAAFAIHPQNPILDDSPVYFFDQSLGNIVHWYWNFGDSTDATGDPVSHIYSDTGSYLITLIVTDADGCVDTVQKTIYINPMFTVWIPNSFTPNDDNTVDAAENEVFKPVGVGWDTKNYFMSIYDRWGREIFYTEDVNEGWNGTYFNDYDCSKGVQGVYIYLIRIADLSGIKHTYKGIVILVQ